MFSRLSHFATPLPCCVYSGLSKRFDNVGYMKPVGQQYVMTDEGVRVDKVRRLA